MNQRDLIHKWAHGLNDGKSGGAVYATGGVLYSYGSHFPLGIRCGDIDGKPAYLLNSRGYSVSTSKHQSWASGATYHGERLAVPMFGPLRSYLGQTIEQMEREQKAGELATLSRGPRKRADGEQAAHGIAQAAKRLPLFLKGAGVTLDRKDAARLRKLAAWAPADPVALAARIEADKVKQARKIRRMEAERVKEQAERLAKWKQGEGWGHFNALALRINGDEVETTQGARVPVDAARILWKGWQAGRDMKGRHVGPFEVNEQAPDHLTIGCHTITLEAAQDFAQRVGW